VGCGMTKLPWNSLLSRRKTRSPGVLLLREPDALWRLLLEGATDPGREPADGAGGDAACRNECDTSSPTSGAPQPKF